MQYLSDYFRLVLFFSTFEPFPFLIPSISPFQVKLVVTKHSISSILSSLPSLDELPPSCRSERFVLLLQTFSHIDHREHCR